MHIYDHLWQIRKEISRSMLNCNFGIFNKAKWHVQHIYFHLIRKHRRSLPCCFHKPFPWLPVRGNKEHLSGDARTHHPDTWDRRQNTQHIIHFLHWINCCKYLEFRFPLGTSIVYEVFKSSQRSEIQGWNLVCWNIAYMITWLLWFMIHSEKKIYYNLRA